jgi:cation transport ATPase
VRDAGVFEAVKNVKTVFFDKTGTLTETDITLIKNHAASTFQKSLILALENISFHPIAFGFRKAFSDVEPALMTELKEIPGVGVCGQFNGKVYELRRTLNDTRGISCGLFENGRHINEFHFESALKPGCASTISSLRQMGLTTVLLTGDNHHSALELGHRIGFRSADVFSGLTPEEKAIKVERASGTMMVGDGINDSLALMRADVGVATSGGVGSAL